MLFSRTQAMGGGFEINTAPQLAPLPDGRLVVVDQSDFELVLLETRPGIPPAGGGDVNGGGTSDYVTGVALLANGSLLVLESSESNSTRLRVWDDYADAAPVAFDATLSTSPGSGPTQLMHPTRVAVDPVDGRVYVSDTLNDRLARWEADGSGRLYYGASGSGVGQFSQPVLLAVLPDRRISVMDVNNNRLVSIDSFESGDSSWQEYTDAVPFSFGYYYNFS